MELIIKEDMLPFTVCVHTPLDDIGHFTVMARFSVESDAKRYREDLKKTCPNWEVYVLSGRTY